MKNKVKEEAIKLITETIALRWDYVSKHQKLSEDFIREFKDKVIWSNISSKNLNGKDKEYFFNDNNFKKPINRIELMMLD